jgi:hypothetical protein
MNKINNLAALFAVTFLLGFVSCQKLEEDGKGRAYSKECNLTGTLIKTFYSKSALNNFWIQGNNGEVYQACANDIINFTAENYTEGQKVLFGTRALKSTETCETIFVECPTGMIMPTQKIGLTCISKVSGKCGKSLINSASLDKEQTVSIENVWQEGNHLKLFVAFSGCNFDASPINLHWDGNLMKSNPAQIAFALGNMPVSQMCLAYFTDTLCYDISSLKVYGNQFSLKVNGYKNSPIQIGF